MIVKISKYYKYLEVSNNNITEFGWVESSEEELFKEEVYEQDKSIVLSYPSKSKLKTKLCIY